MDTATSLNDLVMLESELTRRQTELEQLEAQKRNLDDRVELSTVTIEVVPTAAIPVVEPVEDDTIGDALQSGVDAFLAVAFGFVFVLALLAPFLVAGLFAVAILWFIVRRRQPKAIDPSPVVTPVDDGDREHATPVG
jgi:hypothetical protein